MNDVVLRPARSGDAGFLCSSWLHSFRDSCMVWGVGNDTYYNRHHAVISNLVTRGVTLLAVLESDPDHILGFINYEVWQGKLVFHYVFVKPLFRKMGLAKMMVAKVEEVEARPGSGLKKYHSHRTKVQWEIMKAHPRDWDFTYDPYTMFLEAK